MAEYRRSEIVSGLFILLALVVFALFAFKIGGLDLFWFLRPKTVACVTYLPDVQTLGDGVRVSLGGLRVGQVRTSSLARPEEVRKFWAATPEADRPAWARGEGLDRQVLKVDFELEAGSGVRLDTASARVALLKEGFLGTHFLQLEPGRMSNARDATDLEAPILIIPGGGDVLDELLASGRDMVRELKDGISKFNQQILSTKNIDTINGLLDRLDRIAEDAERFMNELPKYVTAGHAASVDVKILDPARNMIANADQSIDQLRNRLLDVTMKKLDDAISEGKLVLETARGAAEKADRLIADGGPKVQGILDDLKQNTGALEKRLDTVQKGISDLLGGAQGTVSDVRGILARSRPELDEALQAVRRITWELEIAIRKVKANPAVLIFGDDEPVLDVAPLDDGALRRSGRARPFGQREEGGDGK